MEPERKIEKWLRAYAKKRRGQTGDSFKIHPATRRLLQSEISRTAPRTKDDDETIPFWQAIRQMWAFLLGFGVCIFLLAAIFLQSLIETKKKAELADLTIQSSSRLALGTTATPQLAENHQGMQPAAAPLLASMPPGGVFYRLMKPSEGSTQAFASSLGNNTFEEDTFKNTFAASRAIPVLLNFQLQRNGSVIRVVDGDGSVYSGSLASPASDTVLAGIPANAMANDRSTANGPLLKTENAEMESASRAATSHSAQTAEVYSFRVNGINRTLKQNVEFTGSLVVDIAASQPMQQAFGESGRLVETAGNVQSRTTSENTNLAGSLPSRLMRIAGNAIINYTNQIEINAAQIMPAKN